MDILWRSLQYSYRLFLSFYFLWNRIILNIIIIIIIIIVIIIIMITIIIIIIIIHYHYGIRITITEPSITGGWDCMIFFHIHDVQWTSPLITLPVGTKYTETNSCILIHVLRPIIRCNIPVPTKINPQQTSLQLNPATFKLKDPKLNSILVSFQANIFVRCITSKKPSEIFGAQSLEK